MEAAFASADEARQAQLDALNELLRAIIPVNSFYTGRMFEAELPRQFGSLGEFTSRFPLTLKRELVQEQIDYPPYGRLLSFPLPRYSRFHQTSGTSGQPLRWLDTSESWSALIDCWVEVYRAAGVTPKDICYFAFSFGPFLGFWLAFDAGHRLGCLCIPGGGQSSVARLQAILELKVTVLCCTPSYAIHLAEVAAREKIDLHRSQVRLIIVAGEAGGSIPATREQIQRLWPGARVFDHHGMTEVGPVTYECPAHPCRLHVIDWAYLAEVLHPETLEPAAVGEAGELVLTTLKRAGSPLLRYRTGDLVRLAEHHRTAQACACGSFNTALEGGILGRTDDMVVIRGVNVYPSAIEQIVRELPGIAEYQARISQAGALTELELLIEPAPDVKDPSSLATSLAQRLHGVLNLRIPVATAAALPRAELKARRWIKT